MPDARLTMEMMVRKARTARREGTSPRVAGKGERPHQKLIPWKSQTPWFAWVERSREVTGACFGCATSEGEKDLVLSQKIGICNKDNA